MKYFTHLIVSVVLLSLLGSSQSAFAQITRYVSTTGTNSAPASATSWATATNNLQGAIDASVSGDAVWVAAGVYKPTTTTGPDSRTVSFSMKNGVIIYGGFVGNETVLCQRPLVNSMNPSGSMLSGEIGNLNSTADNSFHVINNVSSLSLNSTAILDGFMITRGFTDGSANGSGIYNRNASPTIRNCGFGNSSNGGTNSGHIYNNESSPIMTNCFFKTISGGTGGGHITNTNSRLTLTSCSFVNALGATSGGFLHNDNSTIELLNCSFGTGTASGSGGMIYNTSSNLTMTNCQLGTGSSGSNGGMIYNTGSSNLTLNDCSLGTGVAGGDGGMIFNNGTGNLLFTNCAFGTGVAGSNGGLINSTNGRLTVLKSTFGSTTSGGPGGAIYNTGLELILNDCTFETGNAGSTGGFIYNTSPNPTLSNCAFGTGSALINGGAIYNTGNNPLLVNCLFKKSTSNNGNGALYNSGNNPTLINCSFVDSRARNDGGAIYNTGTSLSLVNCSFQRGFSLMGTGAAIYTSTSATLVNCIAFDNQGNKTFSGAITATYSLFEPASVTVVGVDISGPGNLTTLVSPFSSNESNVLSTTSQAINAGNRQAYSDAGGPMMDVAGNSRFVGAGCALDMGAHEEQSGTPASLVLLQQPPISSVVCDGSTVTVSGSVIGSATSYQWYKDGAPVSGITSATTVSLSLGSVSGIDQGSYSLVVMGSCNSITSTAFSLTVNPLPSVSIMANPSTTLNCLSSLTLTAISSATALKWSTCETTPTISIRTPGTYVVTATDENGCTMVSNTLSVGQLFPPPAAILSLFANESTCPFTLAGRATGTSFVFTGPNYVFSNVYRNGGTYDVFAEGVKQSGVYTLTAMYTNDCGSSMPVSQTVNVTRSCP